MRKSLRGASSLPTLLVVFLAAAGCSPGGNQGPDANNERGGPPAPAATTGPAPGGDASGANPSIRDVMHKVAQGPTALTPMIGRELEANPPDWDAIQGQTKDFSRLAAALGKNDPPRGSRESWEKLTLAYADSAAALDRAAEAKDRDAASAAQKDLAGSCRACHQEHRPMRPGPGGP